jgi:hypothetical protein
LVSIVIAFMAAVEHHTRSGRGQRFGENDTETAARTGDELPLAFKANGPRR